jgi:SsrA-binding protein
MKIIAKNKKAHFDYEVLEKFEAGIKLLGCEVKSCKLGNINLKGSYVTFSGRKPFTKDISVSSYKFSPDPNFNPLRPRELLLHEKEIDKLLRYLETKGLSVIPLEMYLKNNLIKLLIGVCRGKKLYDKRESLKKKDQNLAMKSALKAFRT